jgi:hypothetical protein
MPDVIVKFKGWTKPETVIEALERSLEHAKIEEKWVSGGWFDTASLSDEIPTDLTDDGYGEVDMAVVKEFSEGVAKMECTNVAACSAGIVAIETLDGEALYEYLRASEELSSEWLAQDEVFAGAIKYVAKGFLEVFGEEEPPYEGAIMPDPDTVDGAVHIIVSCNDSTPRGELTAFGEVKHHTLIVNGFEKALAMAKEDFDLTS